MVAAYGVQRERPGAGADSGECDDRHALCEQRLAPAVCQREAGSRDAGARAGARRAPERTLEHRRAQRERWRDGQHDRQCPSLAPERGGINTTVSTAAQVATQLPLQQRRATAARQLRAYLDAAALTCVALGDQIAAGLKHVRFDLLGASPDSLGDLRMGEAAELG
jgi:hypothetical protein